MPLAFLVFTGMIELTIRLVQYWRDKLEEHFLLLLDRNSDLAVILVHFTESINNDACTPSCREKRLKQSQYINRISLKLSLL